MRRLFSALAIAALLHAASSALALEVKLTVKDDSGAARKGGTVTSGVPFAKGTIKDLKKLVVTAGGKKIPAQFRQLAKWPDGSVRWALLDCVVDVAAKGRTELTLSDGGGSAAPSSPVKVTDSPGEVSISTGPLVATVDKKSFNLLKSVKLDGKELITSKGRGLVVYTADKKEVVAGPPTEVKVEDAGPVKATVLLRGKYPGLHKGMLSYSVRITAFAGSKFLKIRAWLENNGAHGYTWDKNKQKIAKEWFLFDGMAIELGLGLGGSVAAECEGVKGSGKFKVYQDCKNAKHYSKPAYGYQRLEYRITTGGKVAKTGQHTDGVLKLGAGDKQLTVAVRDFWQNYYKAIELDADKLKFWLWPQEASFPRKFFDHACPGYARKQIMPLIHAGLYNYPGSVHKGYELILDFSGRPPAESSAELSKPLFALAPAAYYASTEAAPVIFTAPDVKTDNDECNQKLASWTNMTRAVVDPASKFSIWQARKTHNSRGNAIMNGYWYGWMEFGDIPNPGCGYTSLHYGWLMVASMQALRTGDIKFLQLAHQMGRHRVEVDQQWSDRAFERHRGGQRVGYGYLQFHNERFNRAQPDVLGTDLVSPVFYYLLTGDRKVKEAIDRAAPRLPVRWGQVFSSKDYYVRRIPGNMGTVANGIMNYIALHTIDGKKEHLDTAVKLFHKCAVPKAKSLGPHMHGRQQIRSQSYTRDDIRYCHALPTFCQLHHLTGDKKILDVLKAGADKDFPENFFDAPLFLADLHAYVALKTGKSDYADDAVEHWIEAWPESKCPPVFLYANTTWSKRKPMQMRTGHWLQYYFRKKK